jgi:hypothetical protein
MNLMGTINLRHLCARIRLLRLQLIPLDCFGALGDNPEYDQSNSHRARPSCNTISGLGVAIAGKTMPRGASPISQEVVEAFGKTSDADGL